MGILSKVEELQEVRTMLATEINRVRQETARQKSTEVAKKMLEEGLSIDIIIKCTGLTLDEIKKLMQ